MLGAVVESRKPTWVEDHCNFLRRNGYVEETYFTFSYSPLFLDDGRVADSTLPSRKTRYGSSASVK
jgi:hypothetical protein